MALHEYAAPVMHYSSGILNWTVMEFQAIDRKVRKLLKQHRALHPCADVDRLYLPRSLGGRGLLSVEGRNLALYMTMLELQMKCCGS